MDMANQREFVFLSWNSNKIHKCTLKMIQKMLNFLYNLGNEKQERDQNYKKNKKNNENLFVVCCLTLGNLNIRKILLRTLTCIR